MNYARLSALVLVSLTGCAQVLGIDDTVLNEGPLRCKGTPPTSLGTFDASIKILNVVDKSSLPNITVKACSNLSQGICSPAISTAQSGDDGIAVLKNINTFDYLRIEGTVAGLDEDGNPAQFPIKTTHLYSMRPFEKSTTTSVEVGDARGFEGLVTQLGMGFEPPIPYEAARGYLTFDVRDCDDKPLSGIKVESTSDDGDSIIYYLGSGGFDDGLASTTDQGRGGIFSLPNAATNLTFRVASSGNALNDDPFGVRVYPDIVTSIVAYPR